MIWRFLQSFCTGRPIICVFQCQPDPEPKVLSSMLLSLDRRHFFTWVNSKFNFQEVKCTVLSHRVNPLFRFASAFQLNKNCIKNADILLDSAFEEFCFLLRHDVLLGHIMFEVVKSCIKLHYRELIAMAAYASYKTIQLRCNTIQLSTSE